MKFEIYFTISELFGAMTLIQQISSFLIYHDSTCETLPEYLRLRQAISSQPCLSNTQIWSMIEPIAKHRWDCLHQVITDIKAFVDAMPDHGELCLCNGDLQKTIITIIPGFADYSRECVYWSPECHYLMDYFFILYEQLEDNSPCQTHHYVWRHLNGIHVNGPDLQHYLIAHLNQTYSSGRIDTCTCKDTRLTTSVSTAASSTSILTSTLLNSTSEATSNRSTIPSATSTITSASLKLSTQSTNILSTTSDLKLSTSSPIAASVKSTILVPTKAFPTCKKYQVISDIASSRYESHPDARVCPSGDKTSHEALVLANCDTGPTNSWRKGENVMSTCSMLPSYIPVASISSGNTGLSWDRSGIFLGCLGDGFKMAYQDCDTLPTLARVVRGNGTGVHDPFNYFVILN